METENIAPHNTNIVLEQYISVSDQIILCQNSTAVLQHTPLSPLARHTRGGAAHRAETVTLRRTTRDGARARSTPAPNSAQHDATARAHTHTQHTRARSRARAHTTRTGVDACWRLALTCTHLWNCHSAAAARERLPIIREVAGLLSTGKYKSAPPCTRAPASAPVDQDTLQLEIRPGLMIPQAEHFETRTGRHVFKMGPEFRRRTGRPRTMEKVLKSYCHHAGIDARGVHFELDGRPVQHEDTYSTIGLTNDASLGVHLDDEHRRQMLLVFLCRCSFQERSEHEHLLPKVGPIWLPLGKRPET